jgi:hypothetical protein
MDDGDGSVSVLLVDAARVCGRHPVRRTRVIPMRRPRRPFSVFFPYAKFIYRLSYRHFCSRDRRSTGNCLCKEAVPVSAARSPGRGAGSFARFLASFAETTGGPK